MDLDAELIELRFRENEAERDGGIDVTARVVADGVHQRCYCETEGERDELNPTGGAGRAHHGTNAHEYEEEGG